MQRMLSDRITFPMQQCTDLSKELNWYNNNKVITTLHNLQSLLFFYLFLSRRSVSGKKLCSSCGQPLGKGAAMIIETLSLYFHIQCFKVSDRGSAYVFISINTQILIQIAFFLYWEPLLFSAVFCFLFIWLPIWSMNAAVPQQWFCFVAVYSKLLSTLTWSSIVVQNRHTVVLDDLVASLLLTCLLCCRKMFSRAPNYQKRWEGFSLGLKTKQ